MSAHDTAAPGSGHASHAHAGESHANHDPHLHSHGDLRGHGSLRGYLIGFGLSVVLTAVPFWLVMAHVFSSTTATTLTIMAFAFVQIVVHMVFFLHMNTRSEGGWSLMALVFTVVVVVITLSGSIWVMYHLNSNMMPMTVEQVRDQG